MKLDFVIPLAPVVKKNCQQIIKVKGRPMIVQSARYRQFEKDCRLFMPRVDGPIDFPVNVQAVYYMPTRRRVDRSNLDESLHDVLVRHKILADDNRDIIASTDGSRVYYDKENPRIEVLITEVEDYEQWRKNEKGQQSK